MAKRAAVYLRISKTDEGDSLGIDRQRESVTYLAKAKGWSIDPAWVIAENNVSASKKKQRPGFERLLQGMKDGEFDAVLAYAVDRLVRGLGDTARLIDVAEEYGVAVATVAGDIDLSTGHGRGMAKLLGVVASIEVDNMGERMKQRKRQNAQNGSLAGGGQRPYGFTKDRTEVVPEEVEVIRRATRQILDGATLSAVARNFNREGVPTSHGSQWTLPRLQATLSRPSLCGRVMYKGVLVRDPDGNPIRGEWGYEVARDDAGHKKREKSVNGRTGRLVRTDRWETILSEEEFERLQVAINARRQGAGKWTRHRVHLLSGLARCGRCNGPMTGFKSSKGAWSYMCQAQHHLSRVKDQVDAYLIGEVKSRAAETVFKVDQVTDQEGQRVRQQIAAFEEKKAVTVKQLVDGKIDAATLTAVIAEFDSRIETLRSSQVGRAVEAQTLNAVKFGFDRWDEMEIAEQHAAIRLYVRKIVIQPAGRGHRSFDPDLIEIEWRDLSTFRWRGIVEA